MTMDSITLQLRTELVLTRNAASSLQGHCFFAKRVPFCEEAAKELRSWAVPGRYLMLLIGKQNELNIVDIAYI